MNRLLLPLFAILIPAAKLPDARTVRLSSISEVLNDPNLVSLNQRLIPLLSIAPFAGGVAKHRFYIQGGLHGNETATVSFVHWLADRIARNEGGLADEAFAHVQFDFVPVANPDGYEAQNRYNARSINLNRNFSVFWGVSKENPGAKSFSEPETMAVRALLSEHQYTGAVDVHGFVNWVVSPSEKTSAPEQRNYRHWLSHLQQELPGLQDYEMTSGLKLGDGGAFEDWAFWEKGVYAFCLEMKSPFRQSINLDHQKIDSFLLYEKFIAQMFRHALDLKVEAQMAKN